MEESAESDWGCSGDVKTDYEELWATKASVLGSLPSVSSVPTSCQNSPATHAAQTLVPNNMPFSFLQGKGGGKG